MSTPADQPELALNAECAPVATEPCAMRTAVRLMLKADAKEAMPRLVLCLVTGSWPACSLSTHEALNKAWQACISSPHACTPSMPCQARGRRRVLLA
jgi:hypothetical protein